MGDASTSQGRPRIVSHHQKLGEKHGNRCYHVELSRERLSNLPKVTEPKAVMGKFQTRHFNYRAYALSHSSLVPPLLSLSVFIHQLTVVSACANY